MAEQEYRTEMQNYLIANAESDIRIVKHKIDDMKEEYRQFDDDADFTDRLEALYIELGNHEHRLTMIKMHPYNSPIITDTSCHNPFAEALVSGILGDVDDDSDVKSYIPLDGIDLLATEEEVNQHNRDEVKKKISYWRGELDRLNADL